MSLTRLWAAWVVRWTHREPATTLALFRIALGSIVLVDILTVIAAGAVDPLFTPVSEGGFAPATRYWSPWVELFGHSTAMTWGVFGSIIALSSGVILGIGGRVTAFFLLQAVLTMHALPIDIGGGYDRLTTNGLWLLVLGETTATLSLDCWLRERRWTSARPVSAMARYLGLFQLVVVYVVTGFEKRGPGWSAPYDAVYQSLQRWAYVRFGELSWLGDLYPATQFGTVVAWWWEVSFFVLGLWFVAHFGWVGERARTLAHRFDLRWPYLGIGIFLHLSLAVLMNLGTFTAVTLAFYVLCFDPIAAGSNTVKVEPSPRRL